jgi:hypothetical protein
MQDERETKLALTYKLVENKVEVVPERDVKTSSWMINTGLINLVNSSRRMMTTNNMKTGVYEVPETSCSYTKLLRRQLVMSNTIGLTHKCGKFLCGC